jgi:DHA1 family multidrug resistance protein-like MFS transporter
VARVNRWVPKVGGLPREVSVLAAIAFCVALGFGIVIPAIPLFARTFGVSALAASAVISVFAAMRLVSSPAAGWAVDRVGERVVMSTGLAIVGLSSLAAGLATDFMQLLVLRGVGGTGSAMFTISAPSSSTRPHCWRLSS